MRIALLTEKYTPDPGGLAVSVRRLALGLTAAGHQPEVFSLTARLAPGQVERAEHDGVLVHALGVSRRTDDTLSDWFACLTARHQEAAFDVLHGYYLPQAGFVAAYAGRYLGLPSVVSARGNDMDRALFDPGKAGHIRYALEQAGAVTANTRDLVRKAYALAPACTAALVPNGVDSELFAPRPRDETLARSLGLMGQPCLGFVGEARAKKGLAVLLMAYRMLPAPAPAPALLLVGGVRGDDKDTLRVFQKQNPALPVVVLEHAPHETLPAIYGLLDVLVLPSLRDGLPNALLEGMACERAVLATAAGGIPDAVRHDHNGWLVAHGDADALAAGIVSLLADGELRARLGRAARATVVADFTLRAELALNEQIYAGLLSKSS